MPLTGHFSTTINTNGLVKTLQLEEYQVPLTKRSLGGPDRTPVSCRLTKHRDRLAGCYKVAVIVLIRGSLELDLLAYS